MNFWKVCSTFWQSIAGRFAITVFLVSFFVGFIATTFLMSKNVAHVEEDYGRMLDRIHLSSEQTLLTGLWLTNDEVVETVLIGFMSLPGVEEVRLSTESGENLSKGQVHSQKLIKHEHPLLYTYRGKKIFLGDLSITVGLDPFYQHLLQHSKHLLPLIVVLSLVAGAIVLILFNWLVGRHLGAIAEHSASLHFDKLDSTFSLNRKKLRKAPDELDYIVDSFNKMCQSLRQSLLEVQSKEQMFEDIVTNSHDIIFRFDTQGNVTYANPAAKEHIDNTFGESIRKQVPFSRFSMTCSQKSPLTVVIRVKDPGDASNVRSFDLRLSPELSNEGEIKSLIGIAHDITKRNRESELLRAIFDNTPVLMTISDIVTGEYQDLNNKFSESTGYTREQAIGLTSVELGFLRTEDSERISNLLREKAIGESLELSAVKADGKEMICNYNCQIITVGGEKKLLSLTHDITIEKKMMKEQEILRGQLIQATKMEAIGTLAGGIAHDFNNILSAILGFAQMAMEELEDQKENSTACQHMNQVLQAGYRAADLVTQILTFSRQSEEEFQPYLFSNIVKEVAKLLRSTIPASIEIITKIEVENKFVDMDPSQIHQLLMNVMTNARHAIGTEHGKISITLGEEFYNNTLLSIDGKLLPQGNYQRLTIQDNGKGMSPEIKARVFEPFFTTKLQGEGTGMGMAVCHGIISNHKGTITIESEMGKGTAFNIYLPTCPAPHLKPQGDFVKKYKKGTERVLLIDDEKPILRMLEKALTKLGYKTETFFDATGALNYFVSHSDDVDIVITDMAMPKMTGLEMAQEILKQCPEMPIILCTGFTEATTEETVRQSGIRTMLSKPVIAKELHHIMRDIFDA